MRVSGDSAHSEPEFMLHKFLERKSAVTPSASAMFGIENETVYEFEMSQRWFIKQITSTFKKKKN